MQKKHTIYYKKSIRNSILVFILVFIMMILLVGLYIVQVTRHDIYQEELKLVTSKVVYGKTAPRGRIYDRNGKIIVDNKETMIIYYIKENNITNEEEIAIANTIANNIEVDYSRLNDYMLKTFFVLTHEVEFNQRITDEEYEMYEKRIITKGDIEKLKLERVKDEEIARYDSNMKEVIYIYYLMNDGYRYQEHIIKSNATIEEYAYVGANIDELRGINIRLDWVRIYPYNETFRSILGNVSLIPYAMKDYYLDKGYTLDDIVGTSYLEYYYDDILKGTKNKYLVNSDGEWELIEEGKKGNDIVLTIDIELQSSIEKLMERLMRDAKRYSSTKYYDKSYVVIEEPNTGEILAMAGKQIIEDKNKYYFLDYTAGIITNPITAGSVIKGASHIVGYNTGSLKIGEIRDDTCIKIAYTNTKCSWTYLGYINDITALTHSSNTYQYNTAIKVSKGKYSYNKPLIISNEAFDIYRNTFKEFGLGVKTGIDLPNEISGYKGVDQKAGLLLDFAIGQYDNYTVIQLSQYIGVIANDGVRMQPHLLKGIYVNDKFVLKDNVALNRIKTDTKYLKRVQTGFKTVLSYGTGYGYIDLKYKPAGKTGTSQSFVDTDGDAIVDTETITHTFVGYAPYDDPKVTFTVVSPHISTKNSYQVNLNKRLVQEVSKKYFQFYN